MAKQLNLKVFSFFAACVITRNVSANGSAGTHGNAKNSEWDSNISHKIIWHEKKQNPAHQGKEETDHSNTKQHERKPAFYCHLVVQRSYFHDALLRYDLPRLRVNDLVCLFAHVLSPFQMLS